MVKPTVGMDGRWDYSDQIRYARALDFSVIGVAGLAPNKHESLEYNRCYTASTSDTEFWNKVGEGDILDAVRSASKGAGDGTVALTFTIVIVEEGAGADELAKKQQTIVNIAGQPDQRTGVYAFLKATAHNAVVPRLLCIAGGYSGFVEGSAGNAAALALGVVCASLYGFGYIDGFFATEAEAIGLRELYNDKNLALVAGGVNDASSTGELKPYAGSAYVAGAQASVDIEKGGVPSHVASMVPIRVPAPSREIEFRLNDGANEGQRLLQNQIGIFVRGDSGADFAAAEGGVIYVGPYTLASDPLQQFINVVRMENYMLLLALRVQRVYLNKYNMSLTVAKSIASSVYMLLDKLADRGHIYPNPSVYFDPSKSEADNWRGGILQLNAKAEPRAPLMFVDTTMMRDRAAIQVELLAFEDFTRLNLV